MDFPSVLSVDVFLDATEELRRSFDSNRSRKSASSSVGSNGKLNTSTYSLPSKYSGKSFSGSNNSLRSSTDSTRTWPRNTLSKKTRPHHSPFGSNRFLKSTPPRGRGSKSCALHSHSSGADVCPFDGSKYTLNAFTRSAFEPWWEPEFQNLSSESDSDGNSNNKTRDLVIPNKTGLNSDLWRRQISHKDKNKQSFSLLSKTSSCRLGAGERKSGARNLSGCSKRSTYGKIGSGWRNDYTAFSSPSSSFRPIDNPRDNGYPDNSDVCDGQRCDDTVPAGLDKEPKSEPISDFRKDLEAKYESYREQYLTNSPTEELQTLNVTIVDVRKWLRKRNEALKGLTESDSNKLLHDSHVFRRLISEAKAQQEGVDILLDRGQRFLGQRANIVLEVDLENLVFLWNSYVEDLRKLYTSVFKETDVVGSAVAKNLAFDCVALHNSDSSYNLWNSQEDESSPLSIVVTCDQEYDAVETSSNLNCKEKISYESKGIDSSEAVSFFDSSDLTLADLSTDNHFCQNKKDTNSIGSNLTVIVTCDNSYCRNKCATDRCQNGDHVHQEKFRYGSVLSKEIPSPDSEKMDVTQELLASSEVDQNNSSLYSAPNADEEKDFSSQLSCSPKGSSEALSYFDKPCHQLMDCISLGGSPTEPKRRRRLLDTPSSVSTISSRSGSPISCKDSGSTTPTGTLTRPDRQNDLWKAIGNIDNFLLDQDILEACKSTERDLSSTDEDCVGTPSVSFAEFLQQYKELIDWLNQMHKVVQREVTSMSEKYMNQAYHEEMLERSPRREFLNTYSVLLLVRYPNLSEQIGARMNRLNTQWTAVEGAIAPKHGKHDEESMLQDLECDLSNLRRWMNAVESRLLHLTIQADWTDADMEDRLQQHQALHADIESHNKVINAVLKLSDRLEKDLGACGSNKDRDSLQLVALNLEHRLHSIWLRSLEWQCRLEEAIGRRKGVYQSGFDFSRFSLPVLDESLFNNYSQDSGDPGGLITLNDDSLLFIGGGRDFAFNVTESQDSDVEEDATDGSNRWDTEEQEVCYSDELREEYRSPLCGGPDEDSDDPYQEILQSEQSSCLTSQPRSKPDSPLGKRRFTDSHCEGSPAKKGLSLVLLSSSGELSSFGPESPNESQLISSEDNLACPHYNVKPSSPIPIDDLKILKVKRSLFDRSSGDSANISETESKMGDSPPDSFPDAIPVMASSDSENNQAAVAPANKVESKDIGYSSENQSNDEVEAMGHQIDMEYKYPGMCELAGDGPLGAKVLFLSVKPHPDYYRMTHVTDVDSTDKTDFGDTTDSSPEKPQEKAQADNGANSGTDEFDTTVKDLYYHLNVSNSDDQDKKESSASTKKIVTSNSFCQTEPPLYLVPINQIVDFSESDSAPESKGKKSVRYLIEHAEDLVRPSTNAQRAAGSLSPQKVTSSTQCLLIPSPSKQTQTDAYSTVESSCDASGEDNSDHEGAKHLQGDLSLGSDDAEDRTLCDSVVHMGSATESSNNISMEETKCSFQNSPVLDTPRLRKQTGLNSRRRSKKDRPWSVVGFQDSTTSKKSDVCLPVVGASESAINNRHCYTDSDSCSTASPILPSSYSSTFPRSGQRQQPYSLPLCSQPSYHNIVTATQNLTTTTPAIQNSISSFLPQTSLVPSDMSSGAEQLSVKHRQRRARRHRKSSSQEAAAQRHSATDSYESADAESESETADEYLTANMEVCTSEGDDVHNVSGSLSEHSTWDNYQMFYPTPSEDQGEELLTWEPQDELEFDECFHLRSDKSIVVDAMMSQAKTKLKIKKQGTSGEASDSDLEDFHDILNQSELQLKLANQSLKKKRNDPMGTSLHPNPDKYGEILETYDTNKKCLETICQHLKTEDVSEADVKRVQDLMEQWNKVYDLASERHSQTVALGDFRDLMSTMNSCVQDAGEFLPFERFNSADELKKTILQLKEKQLSLANQMSSLDSVKSQISEFASQHPSICLDKYTDQRDRLAKATSSMHEKVRDHVESLENNWGVWVEYLDSQKELDGWLAADRERLHRLLSQREFGSVITKKDVLKELETLQSNLSVYETKLSVLQAMRARLTRTSNDDAQRLFLASLADLRNQLFVVSERCKQIYKDADDDDELPVEGHPDFNKLAIQASTLHELMQSDKSFGSKLSVESEDEEVGLSTPSRTDRDQTELPASKVCMSWLRSVPVQVVSLVLVAGLVCALDPDILEKLTNFSITVTPELRHVNGPPCL